MTSWPDFELEVATTQLRRLRQPGNKGCGGRQRGRLRRRVARMYRRRMRSAWYRYQMQLFALETMFYRAERLLYSLTGWKWLPTLTIRLTTHLLDKRR